MAYYYLRDHLGSVRELFQIVSGTPTLVARYSYDPYGRTTLVSGSNIATFQYAGMLMHQPSGDYQTWFRIYDTTTGRWLSRDPMGEGADSTLYSYADNDPVGAFDPFGLAWESTATQGIHYNDRGSDFGFGLGLDKNNNLIPVFLGGNHTFDADKAKSILSDAVNNKTLWNQLRQQNAQNHDNPSYRDQDRCAKLGRAMRIAAKLGLLAYVVNAATSPLAEDAKAYVNADDQQSLYNASVQVAADAQALGMTDEGSYALFTYLDQE